MKGIFLAINQFPRGTALLVSRYFNADLDALDGNCREEEIVAAKAATSL